MHQSHSRRSTRSRLGKGGYGPLNQFLFSHLKRNPAILSSLPHIFLEHLSSAMAWPMQSDLHHVSRSRVMAHARVRAARRAGRYRSISAHYKTFIEWYLSQFSAEVSGPFQDRFAPSFMFRARHHGHFPPLTSHGDTVTRHNHVSSSTRHTPRSPTRLHPPARPLS